MEVVLSQRYRSAPWLSRDGAGGSGPEETTALVPSSRVRAVASMFGLGLDAGHEVAVLPETVLRLPGAGVVFVTGPSGGGKSTLLRCLHETLRGRFPGVSVFRFDPLVGGRDKTADRPLIDALSTPTLEDALRLLSMAGLNDAFVMLRRPGELSDGQRARFALAEAMAKVERSTAEQKKEDATDADGPRAVVLADEFGAALDRVTAKVVARNVAKWARRSGVCLVAATTHDDLLEALRPEVLVEQGLGGRIAVHTRDTAEATAS